MSLGLHARAALPYWAMAISALWAGVATADIDCLGTTPIYEIQGSGHVSPYIGRTVETCGIVTAVAFNGYYLQDPQGDGNDATSDGIFVLQFGSRPAPGTLLRLRDEVTEFIPGGAATGNLSTTNLTFPTILASETGHGLPAPVIIGRGGRIPPAVSVISADETDPPINLQNVDDAASVAFDPAQDGIDFYESLEGMLVSVESPVAVSAIRQFGRFSAEVFVLANNGKDAEPSKARTERGGIYLQPDADNRGDQNPERIQIQFDGTLFGSTDYPGIKLGDRLDDVTGVVGYSFGNFEVNALGPVAVTPSALTPQTAQASTSSKPRLSVASYNVLNLSAVSADDAQRELIARQIADNLGGPDIIALQEIQDNNGDIGDCPGNNPAPCADVLDASATLQALADAISAAGGPNYGFFTVDPLLETTDDNRADPDTFGGVSLGNIRNAFLYNPARVDLLDYVGLSRTELAARGVSAATAFDNSRDPLLGVFSFRGQRIEVINNHFSSRFGSSPIFGGPQPFVQAAEAAREAQAQAMHELTRFLLEADDDARVIVLGDLNTFEFTDDLEQILPGQGKDRILHNLIDRNRENADYTFIFEGNSQALDHIFVSDELRKGARLQIVHVNVDFPRLFGNIVASDHEPVLASFRIDRGNSDPHSQFNGHDKD